MYGLDLFSGIGGISLALKPWTRTITYCENDRYCQSVLLSRMQMGDLDSAPIWDDVRTLSWEQLEDAQIDIIYGGFPCQDISVAGRGVGLAGERSGLFYQIARLVGEIRPRFVFLENVPAIRCRGGAEVVGALAGLGYDCRWDVLSAYDVGAPHLRERWFLLGHAAGGGRRWEPRRGSRQKLENGYFKLEEGVLADSSQQLRDRSGNTRKKRRSEDSDRRKFVGVVLANADGKGMEKLCGVESGATHSHISPSCLQGPEWWATEPNVGRVANGIPSRVDRLRGLGNAVVPQQARKAFERLMGI